MAAGVFKVNNFKISRERIFYVSGLLIPHLENTGAEEEEEETMCLSAASGFEDTAVVAFFSELNDIFRREAEQ